jgi:hypothetical protein
MLPQVKHGKARHDSCSVQLSSIGYGPAIDFSCHVLTKYKLVARAFHLLHVSLLLSLIERQLPGKLGSPVAHI